MAYRVLFTESAIKELLGLERDERERVKAYLRGVAADPRSRGAPLKGRFRGQWRYRIGGLRVLCHIDDERRELLVLRVRWRKDAYR